MHSPNITFLSTPLSGDTTDFSHTNRALPDVLPTPRLLGPLLKCTHTFVLIQNGVDIHQDLRAAVPEATIISGCAWIDTTAVNGGRLVKHASVVNHSRILLHLLLPFPPRSDLILARLAAFLLFQTGRLNVYQDTFGHRRLLLILDLDSFFQGVFSLHLRLA